MKKTTVGIDLGTTYSLVALVQDGAPIVLENSLGELLTPSVVGLSDTGEILVGAPAQARLTTHPELTASVFKRTMGTDASYTLGARQFRSEELSALVLKTLREDAEKLLGRPIDEAVVTVPAYFGELQRRATRDACEIAGIHVERIINEPTAAALAFGLHQKDRELKAIVLDLGGGTFDVTALEILEGVVEIQSSAGDSRLGGEDFTEALAEWVERAVTAAGGARPAKGVPQARLRAAAEAAKKSLSAGQTAKMALFGLALQDGRTIDWEGEVTREQAEVAWAPLLTRLEAPIRRALADARWNSDVDEILLVGGATRMPVISSLAARLFGRLPQKHLPPDEAVAWGAAIQASLKAGDGAVEDLVVTDVAPFSLGISVVEKVGTRQVEGIFLPILERGTVLPASRTERVSTVSDHQREIVVQIYQGEHSHCSSNQKLGEYRVQGIPRATGGQESIDIRLTYDLNGVLEVESTITSTGKVATLVIERSPGRLSASQIAEARRAMARLKFHPKDALPNKTALGRADALYVEATGELRAALGQAISSFRADLETQDPDRIHEGKENLLRVCSEVRRLLGRTDMF